MFEMQLEIETAAFALTRRFMWPTYELSLWRRERGAMDFVIAKSALSASSHTNFLSCEAFSSSCNNWGEREREGEFNHRILRLKELNSRYDFVPIG